MYGSRGNERAAAMAARAHAMPTVVAGRCVNQTTCHPGATVACAAARSCLRRQVGIAGDPRHGALWRFDVAPTTRPLVAEVLVDGAEHRLIRRRQTVEELLSLELGL